MNPNCDNTTNDTTNHWLCNTIIVILGLSENVQETSIYIGNITSGNMCTTHSQIAIITCFLRY